MQFFGVQVKSFNMEITNRCVLGCPQCARTGNDWVAANLTDLPLDVLRRLFPRDRQRHFEGIKVNLCGTYGDCIYHRRFHDVLAYLKEVGVRVAVETNGSHRKPGWWERTCDLLGPEDMITFSVDGLEDTNHIYRVNARWTDIVEAMRYCASRVTVDWKFIVFSHNEHQLDDARRLATEIGVRRITFKKSGRFLADDPSAPSNEDYIGVVTRNRRRIERLLAEGVDAERFDEEVVIAPKCRYGKDLAVTAFGHFYPCSPAEPEEPSGWFHDNREHFDLRAFTVEEILASEKWRELERLWQRASTAPKVCQAYCGVHRAYLDSYASSSRPDRPNKPEDAVAVTIAG